MKTIKKGMAILVLAMAVICSAGFVLNDIDGGSHDKGNGSLNGHDYVDLGLPSGTLWATCNVGAKTPEEYGDYFAWGEIQPKTDYRYETYKYGKCESRNDYIKYNYGFLGDTDNIITLEPDDDAATVNWGSGWRIPTREECEELLDHTSKRIEIVGEVKGMTFTGPNGNSIFLPAAGEYWGNVLKKNSNAGNYWSNTRYTPNSIENYVWYLCYDDSGYYDTHAYGVREIGKTVRPVCSVSKW